jgi:hypothetical protein
VEFTTSRQETTMYYISEQDQWGYSRVCKRLSDFAYSKPAEGSKWMVRTKRRLEAFDSCPVYEVKGGKLRKTTDYIIVW